MTPVLPVLATPLILTGPGPDSEMIVSRVSQGWVTTVVTVVVTVVSASMGV